MPPASWVTVPNDDKTMVPFPELSCADKLILPLLAKTMPPEAVMPLPLYVLPAITVLKDPTVNVEAISPKLRTPTLAAMVLG